MLLALLTTLTCGQLLEPASPDGPIYSSPSRMNRLAFFEAFPASGAGTFGPCSTTAPTGARGEALTFARTGSATCTKTATGGLATTGIADGDLVVLSANQSRVEYDSNGVLGLRVEGARTNSTLRSEELDVAAVWQSNNSGIALPAVTANAATSPAGTLTADRVQIPGSTTGGQYSQLYQLSACPAGAAAQIGSYYIKGVSGSGSICFKIGTSVQNCSYVSTSWTRCTPTINAAASTTVAFAVDVTACGANAAGVDAYVWGVQCENSGAYATSYIPTVAASATRNAENARFDITTPATTASLAATRTGPAVAAQSGAYVIAQTAGSSAYGLGIYLQAGARRALVDIQVQTVAGSPSSPSRAWTSWDGTTHTVNFDGTQQTATPVTTLAARNSLSIGLDTAGGGALHADGIVSRVCLDPSPTRCR